MITRDPLTPAGWGVPASCRRVCKEQRRKGTQSQSRELPGVFRFKVSETLQRPSLVLAAEEERKADVPGLLADKGLRDAVWCGGA